MAELSQWLRRLTGARSARNGISISTPGREPGSEIAAAASNPADSILAAFEAAMPEILEKREFLALVDRETPRLHGALRDVYGSYASLLGLKLCNLAVGKYHYLHRHTVPASRPVQLMLDPSNSCQLRCPGCVHTANPSLQGRFPWPNGLLNMEIYERFMRMYGPFACGVVFYNYGEPLLNKRTPEIIRFAKRYFVNTCLSTNLSLPFDVDALVCSGLNRLFLSFDGATQETYALYRRRGNLDLCFENVRKLVEARRRNGTSTPHLLWKYLTFEHNEHEIDLAIRTARELGVDEICIATPSPVDWDDPSVRAVDSPKAGTHAFRDAPTTGPLDHWDSFAADVAPEVDAHLAQSWVERAAKTGALSEPSRASSPTCSWLYQSITLDARGSIMPCCMPPERTEHRVYGSFPDGEPDPFLAKDMIASRLAFADRPSFVRQIADNPGSPEPFCAKCTADPDLTYSIRRDARRDLAVLDPRGVIAPGTVQRLTDWPGSR